MFAGFGKALGATLSSFVSQASLAMGQPIAMAWQAFMLADAGLSQPVRDRLNAHGEAVTGERVRIITGLGMTESAPPGTSSARPARLSASARCAPGSRWPAAPAHKTR